MPILGSNLIPYPRFVASMVKHNFQYAPIIGMLPLERLAYRTQQAVPKYSKSLQRAIDSGKLTDAQRFKKAEIDSKKQGFFLAKVDQEIE